MSVRPALLFPVLAFPLFGESIEVSIINARIELPRMQ